MRGGAIRVGKLANMPASTAILIGCAMISISVIVAVARLGEPAPTPVAAPVAAPAPTSPPVTPQATVEQQAREALAYQRAALQQRCPAPPGAHRFVFNVTFDAQGVEVVHGIAADRSNPRSELAACLSAALAPLRVPPPGATTMVELPWALP